MGVGWIGRCVLAVAVVGSAGACSSSSAGGTDAAFTLDELRTTGDRCPVDLAGTGLAPDGAGEVEVDVAEGAEPGGASGIHVSCRLRAGGSDAADVRAMVVAVDEPGAIRLVLDDAVRLLEGTASDPQAHLAAFEEADAGELVDLGAEGPVVVARIDVDGAESAALYLSCASAAPEDVRDAAEEILGEL